MTLTKLVPALLLTVAGLAVGTPAHAAPAAAHHLVQDAGHHRCTQTSSGSCIRGGEFCPQSSYNHSGYDAQGRRYVCKGNHTHPHWMKP